MPVRVHAAVEDADHLDMAGLDPVENDMRGGRKTAIALADVVNAAPELRRGGEQVHGPAQQPQIVFRLVDIPALGGIVPDGVKVAAGLGGEPDLAQAEPRRLAAR